MNLICSCGMAIDKAEMWILKDIKDFEARKLIIGNCSKCHRPVVTLTEKRIEDGKIFTNENITGNNAIRRIKAEEKRMLCKYYKIPTSSLTGWVYGINTEIKNKKGQVTQVRQYSSDFNGKKKLVKRIKT